jgi:hypothetical protein
MVKNLIKIMDYQNQGDLEESLCNSKKITPAGISPEGAVTLSHPDYNRRLRNYTGSADL